MVVGKKNDLPFSPCLVLGRFQNPITEKNKSELPTWKLPPPTKKTCFFVGLFGMLKWPFQRLSDLQLADKKVTLNHLGCSTLFMVAVMIKFHTTWNYLFLRCLHNNHLQEMFHKQKKQKKKRERKQKNCSRWWFQPVLENISQNGSKWIISPKDRGEIVTKCGANHQRNVLIISALPQLPSYSPFFVLQLFRDLLPAYVLPGGFFKMPPETTPTKSTPNLEAWKLSWFLFSLHENKM